MTVKIDCHLHVFAKPSDEFPREVSPSCPEDREETAEKLLVEMEANDIDQAILTQMGGSEFEHHNYVRHCVDTYPDRFQGIGLIPGNCENPAEHMDRVAGDGHFIGFRLGSLHTFVLTRLLILAVHLVRSFDTVCLSDHDV